MLDLKHKSILSSSKTFHEAYGKGVLAMFFCFYHLVDAFLHVVSLR